MKSAIWISYDLGVRGDYEGLYTWLDEHSATECGDSIAFFEYEHRGALDESLTREIRKAIDVTKQTRVYLIYRDQKSDKMRGKFIIGRRKAAPWSGYAVTKDGVLADQES